MPRGVEDVSKRDKGGTKVLPQRSKTTKGSSALSITSPPRVAIVPGKSGKGDNTVRREKSMKGLLRPSHGAFGIQKPGKQQPPIEVPSDPQANEGSSATKDHGSYIEATDKNTHQQGMADRGGALARSYEEHSRLQADLDDSGPDSSPPHSPMLPISPIGAPENFYANLSPLQSAPESWTTDRGNLEDQVLELQSRVHSLQSDIADRDNYWKAQWERESRERIYERNALAEDLHTAQKDALDKRKQLLDLKQSISSLTHIENQVTDGEVAERMDGLYHRVRNWVVSNYRRSQPDLACLSNVHLQRLSNCVPRYQDLDLRTWKISVYQAMVMRELIYIFQDEHCYGLPHDGILGQVRTLAQELRSTGLEYRKWHSGTVELLLRTSPDSLVQNTKNLALKMADDLLDILHAISSVEATDSAHIALHNIIMEAIGISRLLRVQIPLYSVFLPREEQFDAANMQLTDEQDEEDEQKLIALAVTPCVQKISEETNDGSLTKRTIHKAKVVCLPC
ncbi:hypothetical protein EJ05DRAFT_497035 [Pseudovirgaria hyperparasitica]|uniref:Uncharacterized protein n=1 Tax=Pseudovirgaria hyperparasitica TaxID=470096 RepID=A0A6A6WH89_9PEZI|nr:uncharacterized protein EJ05DRAFT_497035 [Pseudovirgaria hyperparasitica]KAF2762168.1 hypothetical protein EJ05DRAFT_497035 [Pseudovirgaria hyperparasitica]